jgi:energy-coupling factor transporter transmembrane protein EcfT
MKDLLKLLLLVCYASLIFFVSSGIVIAIFALCNIAMMLFVRLPPKSAFLYLRGILPFILLAGVINFFADTPREAFLVVIRLVIVCNITQSFRYILNSTQLANAIEIVCVPLKIFKVNPQDISLMVCICIAFIPVLQRELKDIKCGLRAKNMAIKPKNVKYILKPFLYGIFKRTDEISDALRAKAYS